jgi:hypothetical protein
MYILFRGRTMPGRHYGRKEGPGNESPLRLLSLSVLDRKGLKDRTHIVRKTGRKKDRRQARRQVATHKRQPTFQKKIQGGWLPVHEPISGISIEFQCEFTEKPRR